VALLSAALSVYAIGVAAGAKDNAAGSTPALANSPRGGANVPPSTATAVRPSAAAPKTSSTELDPKANFTPAYTPETQTLIIHRANSGSNYVDLDRPAVGVSSDVAEFYYYGYNNTLRFQDDVQVATSSSAEIQPGDCVDLIQHGALAEGTPIPVGTPDLTMCIVSAVSQAQRQGISRKVALVHVVSVGQDGAVQVTVKAWNIPNG
jgi:hypothetical protein